jgi:glycosyltransferase involved in cell wall biosynthesis
LHTADGVGGRRGWSEPLRVAMLAPPWLTVPPRGYGGIESVVQLLCEQLVGRGHDVTLFAPPGSRSPASLRSPLPRAYPDAIGSPCYEIDHVARAFAEIDDAAERGVPFDVVHDHCRYAALAMADRVHVPVVHTIHDRFDTDSSSFYGAHGHRATLVGISESQIARAPRALRDSPVIPNPVALERWPLQLCKRDYLLWIGRMSAVKGPHRAIAVARMAGRRLVLAGPAARGEEQFFESNVRPHIDGRRVEYAGEVAGSIKIDLFAHAAALLMPIRWPEPFGIVMIEALACGTPVIAFPEGAAAEIVRHGVNGLLVCDEREMAAALSDLPGIDPRVCRASVACRNDARAVAAAYESVYRSAVATHRGAS